VFLVGLSLGFGSHALQPGVRGLTQQVGLEQTEALGTLLVFGVPALLCYTFIDRPLRFGLGAGALLLGMAFCAIFDSTTLYQKRSFFGVLKVEKHGGYHRLLHGTTVHGIQSRDEKDRREPLAYFHRTGPVGHLFAAFNTDPGKNLAVIGLGTGTMACYAHPGQHLTFYDIDPVVRDIAYNPAYFTYISDARARGVQVDLVMGDARLTMERQQPSEEEKYGILCVDAFSSDAIPIHLLTLEALQMYLTKLRDDGVLAFHISNRYLDLRPVLARLAEKLELKGYYESVADDRLVGRAASTWVVLARKEEHLARLPREDSLQSLLLLSAWPDNGTGLGAQALMLYQLVGTDSFTGTLWMPLKTDDKVGLWTDDYSNLLSVVVGWSLH
jgi:spermidine synthase